MSGDTEVLVRNLDDSYVLITGGTSGIGSLARKNLLNLEVPKSQSMVGTKNEGWLPSKN